MRTRYKCFTEAIAGPDRDLRAYLARPSAYESVDVAQRKIHHDKNGIRIARQTLIKSVLVNVESLRQNRSHFRIVMLSCICD